MLLNLYTRWTRRRRKTKSGSRNSKSLAKPSRKHSNVSHQHNKNCLTFMLFTDLGHAFQHNTGKFNMLQTQANHAQIGSSYNQFTVALLIINSTHEHLIVPCISHQLRFTSRLNRKGRKQPDYGNQSFCTIMSINENGQELWFI